MLKVKVSDFKDTVAKLNLAVEKSKINPKAGWIELESNESGKISIKVGNYDYYLEASIPFETDDASDIVHATVTADTFIPLVSKLEDEYVDLCERLNSLILTTKNSEYTFPIIKEMGRVKSIDEIKFNNVRRTEAELGGNVLATIADTDAKGLVDSLFAKDIQQFVYVDNLGALIYTENIYISNFENPTEQEFKFLLNCAQAKLLKVFEGYDKVKVFIESNENYEASLKVQFEVEGVLKLVLITQSQQMIDKFPALKLRNLANAVSDTHAIIDKKTLEKALARLMVFDKKFDVTVLNYSKFVWGEDSVKLVSIKNQNYEVVPYVSGTNTSEHESIIRFADIVNQLKAVQSKELDISYGNSPAITINSYGLKQLIPEIRAVERT